MFSLKLPFSDSAVLLSLPGSDLPGWQRAGLLILIALACLLPLILVLWLYRYELHLVRRITALRLLGLRLILVVLLLAIVCLQPIVGHSTTLESPGRVLIAVDRSASMDATDPQRTPIEKARLARALNLCTDRQLDDWTRRYDEKAGTMRWVTPGDEADRQAFDEACRQVDALTRAQIAQRLLGPEGIGLLQALRGRHEVELVGFDRDAVEVPADRFEELFSRSRLPGGISSQVPPGRRDLPGRYFTDLNQPLARAAADRGRVLGIVLLTDGRHNTGVLPDTKARELGERRVPIYPILLGARRSPPDVAVTKVDAPAAALEGVEVRVTAHIKVSGLGKQTITVAVHRPDAPAGQASLGQATVEHTGQDAAYDVPVVIRLEQPGKQTYLVTARTAANVQEARTDNNSRPVSIQVGGEYKPKVLLVDDEARWEYHYLASALLRDPSVRVERVVLQPPLLDAGASDEYLKRLGNPRRTLPVEPDALRAYDCIVLGDVDPRHLPRGERERLERYVKDSGKTLILLAGKRFLPLAYAEDPQAKSDPLVKLLPIESPHVLDRKEGFRRRPTEDGQLSAFLQMADTPEQSLSLWDRLPPHYWAVIGKAKPAATPLLYWPDDEKAWRDLLESVEKKWPALKDTHLDQVAAGNLGELAQRVGQQGEEAKRFVRDEAVRIRRAQEREQPLVVRQNYGFGRVLYVGLDSTWRWRYKVGDEYHHRFWSQVIHWAAADKPPIRFGAGAAVYQPGQDVELFVRLEEEALRSWPAGVRVAARVLRLAEPGKPEAAVAVVPLTGDVKDRQLTGRVRDLPAGSYAVELAISDPELMTKLLGPAANDPKKARAGFTIVPPDSAELLELGADWDQLERLASASHGKVLLPEDAAELLTLLTRQSAVRIDHPEHKLWQWWPTLVLLLVLLTAEWVGRKLAGLP